jgi:molybdopterin converting factor small subunit
MSLHLSVEQQQLTIDNLLQITLLFFASVRTSIPSEPYSTTLILPSDPTPYPLSLLRQHLIHQVYPGNAEFQQAITKSAWSVDEEMVDEGEEEQVMLKGGETVCPIPPVSGG